MASGAGGVYGHVPTTPPVELELLDELEEDEELEEVEELDEDEELDEVEELEEDEELDEVEELEDDEELDPALFPPHALTNATAEHNNKNLFRTPIRSILAMEKNFRFLRFSIRCLRVY